MLVSDIMTRPVITVDPESRMLDAGQLLKENRISHLCVVKDDKHPRHSCRIRYQGGRSVRRHLLEHARTRLSPRQIKVKEIMTKEPITIEMSKSIEEAAAVMLRHHVSALPVVMDKRPVGIITDTDIFKSWPC